jgi:hypothetical protein
MPGVNENIIYTRPLPKNQITYQLKADKRVKFYVVFKGRFYKCSLSPQKNFLSANLKEDL